MQRTGALDVRLRMRRGGSRPARAGDVMLYAGAFLVALVVVAAILAPLLSPWGPTEIDPGAIRQPPSSTHPLGTDLNGMDVMSRLLHGARLDLLIAILAVVTAVGVGGAIGAISGFVGGVLDLIVMRVLEIIQAFPTFILALAVAALLGPGVVNLTIVVALVSIPSYARLIRAEVRAVRELAFVDAARTSGISSAAVLWKHVLPNSLMAVRVVAPLNVGWAMLSLAGLSFLGLGVPVPEPEWGAMISQGTSDLIAGRIWTTVPPGVALVICVLGFSLLGEGIEERESRRKAR